MNDYEKKIIKELVTELAKKNNQSYNEYTADIMAEAKKSNQHHIAYFFNNFINYSACEILARIVGCSTSAIYTRWQKNKPNYTAFLAAVAKIKPYTAAIPEVPYNWYNSFIFNELLSQNINKHKVFSIEGDTSHIISSKSKSYTEALTMHESSQFAGLTMPQIIVYMAIQSILQAADNADSNGQYTITLRQIYEAIFPARWDKVTEQARCELFNLLLDMQASLSRISTVTYQYQAGKTKLNTGDTALSGDVFFGCCNWQHLQSWEVAEKDKKNYMAISYMREKKSNFEDASFACSKGMIIDLIKYSNRVVHIPQTMICTKNVKNNVWLNYYIARYITLAANSKNKIPPVILLSTIEKYLGSCSRAAIKSIMSHYQQQGLINEYNITAKKIEFSLSLAKEKSEKVKKTKAKKSITILRNATKEDITPAVIPPEITEREAKIRKLNHYYSQQNITIDGKTLSTDLRQIFSGDWNKGGRLYGSKNSYQSIKAADRARLLINGSATVELDYSCSHLNILYAYVGLQAPEDCYRFFPDRKLAKKALLIALNAKNDKAAALALTKEWNAAHPSRTITEAQAMDVIEAAIEAHAPIKQYICSGVGSGLQRIDSELALNIISQCKQQGIVALPIHDSFIVAVYDENKLKKIMQDEYSRYTGGYTCPIN